MALQLGRSVIALLLCISTTVRGQVIYYPSNASDLLKSTAADMASIFGKAIPGSTFLVQAYTTTIPQAGIVLVYDSTITPDQRCQISGTQNFLSFSASEDNGLCFGVYKYLNMLGFRFYLPGSEWEKIPMLNSPFTSINTTIHGSLIYNGWTISGGQNRWIMDNDDQFGWDIYFGQNGHEWAKYQRRNNMKGSRRFSGHRGDILTPAYLSVLQSNPCYVACYNQNRIANSQSVPDINSLAAKDLWSGSINNQYASFKNIVFTHPSLYTNYYHNFQYSNGNIGIEVPDGANWGNSSDNNGCSVGNFEGKPYPGQSDQQFILANYTAAKIQYSQPGRRFQCYAYSNHADVPSSSVGINQQIDVQVIPGAFQFESSTAGLLNRWYSRHSYISEYHYLNIPQWTGEAPIFSLAEFKNTWKRIKEKNAQGLQIESSPAKFASIPFLFAGNRYLQDNIDIDSSIHEFVNDMFPPEIGIHIYKLLQYFGNDNINTGGNFINDNRFKLPLFIQELNQAVTAYEGLFPDSAIESRLNEFKAYSHFLILYYEFITAPGTYENRTVKAAELCTYLAKINKLRLVNSYYLIQTVVSRYPLSQVINTQYNVDNGLAYEGGNLPLITPAEISQNFITDVSRYINAVSDYQFKDPAFIINQMNTSNLVPLDSIHFKLSYTNGYEYSNRSEMYFFSPAAGQITIGCVPHYGMANGFVNISVESVDSALLVVKDIRISGSVNLQLIAVDVPSGGIYKVSFVSKFKTSADLTIYTQGNTFFKKGPFYGDKVESYRDDTVSFPRFIYIPANTSKLSFSVNNGCSDAGCISASLVEEAFDIRNEQNQQVSINPSSFDQNLYTINAPNQGQGVYWRVNKMREYNLCFANISNIEVYAKERNCSNEHFTATTYRSGEDCHTRLNNLSPDQALEWNVNDGSRSYHYTGNSIVDVSALLSPGAVIELHTQNGCIIHKKAGAIAGYTAALSECATAIQTTGVSFNAFPNPSTGVYTFSRNSMPVEFETIAVYGSQGSFMGMFYNKSRLDLSAFHQGMYIVTCTKGTEMVRFRLIKI